MLTDNTIKLSTRTIKIKQNGELDKRSLRGKPLNEDEEKELEQFLSKQTESDDNDEIEDSDESDDEIELTTKKSINKQAEKKAIKIISDKKQKQQENKKISELQRQVNLMKSQMEQMTSIKKRNNKPKKKSNDEEEEIEKEPMPSDSVPIALRSGSHQPVWNPKTEKKQEKKPINQTNPFSNFSGYSY